MKLLLLNAFKGLKKKKIQMIGIVFLVLLSTAVYTGMNSAIDRLEDKYYSYLDDQNVEDITVGINIDLTKDITKSDVDHMLKTSLKDASDDEKQMIYAYREFLNHPSFDVNIIYGTQAILNKYNALEEFEIKKLDKYKEEYDYIYEKELSKTVQNGKHLVKVLPYNKDKKINKVYLVDGRLPEKENEITMMPVTAKKNNLKIGSTYKINDKKYKIVGFTYAPDYVYPLISLSMPIFDEENNNVIYINEANYDDVVGIVENSYSLRYNFNPNRKFKITVSTTESDSTEKTEKREGPNYTDPVFKIFNNKDDITPDMSTFLRIARIGELQLEFASDRLFAEYFLYLLLGISVIIIIIITKKRIEDERLQIGVLKSLGYNKFSIAASYLVYPVVGSLIGGLIGFGIGNIISLPIATILRSYYAVPLTNYAISFKYLFTSIFTPMFMLSLLSYIIALIMLRKKPLQLLKEGSNLKVNIFSKLVNKITKVLPFNQRFKYSLAFRSIGKLFIVTVTSFLTGLLLTLILIGSNIINNVIEKSFGGMEYKYIAYYNGFNELKEKSAKSDYILSVGLGLDKLVDKNGNEKKIDKEQNLSINGIDVDSKYVKLLDKNEKDLKYKLKDKQGAIISRNIKENLKIDIGDTFTMKYEDLEFSYKVIDVSEEYMGFTAYVNREGLAKKIGIPKNSYSTIYSNDKKYSEMSKLDSEDASKIAYLMNMEDLKTNIEKQMDRFNGSIYIVILFASVMSLIIIMVIANIVVEENKKTISLMKVLGYDNKRISKVILNIYTPFIVIAYLISIPVMIKILKAIVAALLGDTKITIPVEADPVTLAFGLIGLLVAYYLALAFSKRVLNKIPLAIALKRE